MKKISPPFYLNAMDPGGTTGLALLHVTTDDYHVLEQCAVPYRPESGSSPIATMQGWHKRYDDLPHVLVYENFHVRPTKNVPDTTALNILGDLDGWMYGSENADLIMARRLIGTMELTSPHNPAIRQLGEIINRIALPGEERLDPPFAQVVKQEPVQAKQLVKDAILHRLGLKAYGRNSVHINDAFRHAATWLATTGYVPVCKRGWPPKV